MEKFALTLLSLFVLNLAVQLTKSADIRERKRIMLGGRLNNYIGVGELSKEAQFVFLQLFDSLSKLEVSTSLNDEIRLIFSIIAGTEKFCEIRYKRLP